MDKKDAHQIKQADISWNSTPDFKAERKFSFGANQQPNDDKPEPSQAVLPTITVKDTETDSQIYEGTATTSVGHKTIENWDSRNYTLTSSHQYSLNNSQSMISTAQ